MPQILPVLLGGDANVYGMARSFYETCGVRSLAVCRRALPALACSRLVRVAVQDPAFAQDTVFTATLLGLAAQHPGKTRLLVPCADGYTRLLARHADALRGAYRFACPPPDAVEALSDKQRFAAACRAAGLRTPQTAVFCPGGAVPDLPFGWPVIVKPADSDAWARCRFPGKRKVYLAGDAAALRAQANPLEVTLIVGKSGISQTLLDEAVILLDSHELVKGRVLETAGLTAREASDMLCEALGAEGIACVGTKFVIWRKSEKLAQEKKKAAARKPAKKKPSGNDNPVKAGLRARKQAAEQQRKQRKQYFHDKAVAAAIERSRQQKEEQD